MGNMKKSARKRSVFSRAMSNIFPTRDDEITEKLRKIIFLFALIVVGVCLCLVGDYYYDNYENYKTNEGLLEVYKNVEEDDKDETSSLSDPKDPERIPLAGANALLEINPDSIGWIEIPGTGISLPVVQGKDNQEYLHTDFKGEEQKAGTLFLDYRNKFGTEDDSDNLIIYGHNMKDQSMFGKLQNYYYNSSYYGEHPLILLNSNYDKFEYVIYGYYLVSDSAYEKNTEYYFNYNNVLDFEDEANYFEYINNVKRRSLILNNVDMEYGDELLTLSTCLGQVSGGRLVIAARRLREGEDINELTENYEVNPNPMRPYNWYQYKGGSYDWDNFEPYE